MKLFTLSLCLPFSSSIFRKEVLDDTLLTALEAVFAAVTAAEVRLTQSSSKSNPR